MFEINGHTPDEYRAYHVHTDISSADPKIEMLEIPLRDGALNTTALLTDKPLFNNRTITIGIEIVALRGEWPAIYSKILSDIHGQAVTLILEEDPGWAWEGYASVGPIEDNRSTAGVTITINAHPFKKRRTAVELESVALPGGSTINYTITIKSMRAYPTFVASTTGMRIQYKGVTYTLPAGESTVYGLTLEQGDNVLSLIGPGIITISYREGTL